MQATEEDPFSTEIPGDHGFRFQMVGGVMQVYCDAGCLEKGDPINWPYPDIASFLSDQNVLLNLISDGPL